MRRAGNNWIITLCMHYKKKVHGEVLEHMVLHSIMNLVASLTYRLRRTLQEGFTAENETVLELYRKFNAANAMRHSSFRRYAARRTPRRGITEQSRN